MATARSAIVLACGLAAISAVSAASAAVIRYNAYYQEKLSSSCPTDSYSCRLNFSKTPAGQYLTITNASCYIERTVPLRILAIAWSDTPNGLTSFSYPMTLSANTTGNGLYYYSTNQVVNQKMAGEKYPFIISETSTPGNGYMSCSIVGELTSK